ncbi:hypothetical protein [Vibrio sp. MMH1-50]|uniref:hypothetical protein n=1 Tax=Vibrio sp. MMH1-50 TaxID=2917764 RepID=UPI001EF3A5B1|nr:hypothetical protein [Vibrio sp. MMH1-50]MCG7518002.1 hypothetical protein [Vibrio sp. MMH1-50]
MKKFLKIILVFACLMILIVITPYAAKYWEQFSNATTQDFANFGTYFSGVLAPLFTLVSALFVGFQILETSRNNKLERLVRDHKEYLASFIVKLDSIKKSDIVSADHCALKAYRNGEGIFLNLQQFYTSQNQLIEGFNIVSKTLFQIYQIDPHQFSSSQGLTFSKADRDILARIERLAFFLNMERGYTTIQDYEWLCKESRLKLKN